MYAYEEHYIIQLKITFTLFCIWKKAIGTFIWFVTIEVQGHITSAKEQKKMIFDK